MVSVFLNYIEEDYSSLLNRPSGMKINAILQHKAVQSMTEGLMQAFQLSSRNTLISLILGSLVINLLSLAFPLAMLQAYDRVIPNRSLETLVVLIVVVFVALFIEAGLRVARSYISAWVDSKYEHNLACRAFNRLMDAPLDIYEKGNSGAYLEHLNSLNHIRSFYASQALSALLDAPFIFIFIIVIAYISGWLALVPLIILVGLIFYMVFLSKNIEALQSNSRENEDQETSFLINILSHIHTVKSIGMEAPILRNYERLESNRSVLNYYMNAEEANSILVKLIGSQSTMVLLVTVGSLLVLSNNLTVGGLVACSLLAGRCIQPLNHILAAWVKMGAVKAARSQVMNILKLPTEIDNSFPSIGMLKGEIKLEDVKLKFKNYN